MRNYDEDKYLILYKNCLEEGKFITKNKEIVAMIIPFETDELDSLSDEDHDRLMELVGVQVDLILGTDYDTKAEIYLDRNVTKFVFYTEYVPGET